MGEEPGGELSVVGDIVGDLVTGIPAPIRKNVFKAFTRLCTAAVEYPVALIEGAVAEKRAETQARVKLINVSARQIAKQMETNPEYARAAVAKFAHKIIRERVNIDQVCAFAAEELKSEPLVTGSDTVPEAPPISEDWLNAFETEGAQISSEQMQRMFGKILAGEIRKPGSYSIKTIKLMAQVDNRAAALFSVLCSLSVSARVPNQILDARVVSFGGNAGYNILAPYGLGFDGLNILQEYGLITAEIHTSMNYEPAILRKDDTGSTFMIYRNEPWVLIPKVDTTANPKLELDGVAFTLVGRELLPIVDIIPNEQYTAALIGFFNQRGITMAPAAR
jgi:hypothetical protein